MPSTNRAVRIITSGVSDGARALSQTLEADGIRTSRVRVGVPKLAAGRLNIKWGCFTIDPTDYRGELVNGHSGDTSLNKLTCFQTLQAAGVPIPEFTNVQATAQEWLAQGCRRIYERHILRGSEGDGIRVVGEGGLPELTHAPLYVKGMHGRRREYRIHVFTLEGVQRLFIQQKRKRVTGVEDTENSTNGTIRNLANGWIFAHNDIVAPRQQTIDAAVGAIRALSLNFGGVDLIEMDDITKGSAVLEINCAPGLQGGTLEFYAQAIKAAIRGDVDQPLNHVETEEEEF